VQPRRKLWDGEASQDVREAVRPSRVVAQDQRPHHSGWEDFSPASRRRSDEREAVRPSRSPERGKRVQPRRKLWDGEASQDVREAVRPSRVEQAFRPAGQDSFSDGL